MAILGDLLVQGRSRFLQQIYAPGISIDGDTTVTGTLTLSKIQDAAGTANNSPALIVGGPVTSSHLEFDSNEIMAKATGTTTADLYINTDGGIIFLGKSGVKTQVQGNLQVQGTSTFTGAGTYSGNLTVNGTTSLKGTGITGDLTVSNNAKINGSLIVEDEIRTPKWIVDNIANLGGEFIIAPTIIGGDNVSVNISGVSNGKYTITVTDSSITSSSFGGIAWSNGSIVKVSGTINDVVLVSINGTMTQALNTTTNTIQFTVNSSDVTLTAGTYTGNKVKNLHIMMYKNAGIVPVGIFMTSYGESKYPYIDIYSGSSSGSSYSPTTRLGYLTGIKDENGNALTVNGVSPTGWGLYTNNGYFSGTIVSTSGKIGGFTIGTTDIHNGKTSRTETTNNGVWVGTDGIGFGKGITYFSTDGTGKIGPWTLSTTYFRNGSITGATNTSVAGVYLGTDGLNISNGTAATTTYITKTAVNVGNKLTWNGTTLTVTGTVNATAGYFGSNSTDGWSISSNAITHGTLGASGGYILNAAGNSSATINGSSRSNLALAIGSKFGVGNDGTLYTNGANITNINASNINAGTLNISYLPESVKNENIEVGGRNLFPYSNMKEYYGGILRNSGSYYSVVNNEIVATSQPTSGPLPGWQVNNGTYIISGTTSLSSIVIYVQGYDSNGQKVGSQKNASKTVNSNGYFERTIDDLILDGVSYFYIGVGSNSVQNYTIKPKLEKGNKATDWTPAPEDVDADILTKANVAEANAKSYTDDALAPIATKTYTGIIGTVNDANNASFYFAKIHPTSYDGTWVVKLRIEITAPTTYQQTVDISISGRQGSFMSYDAYTARSTAALGMYFVNLYRATSAGITANAGHALGFGLRASTNPTSSTYARTIKVDILEVINCTVAMLDTAVKYDSMPNYSTTNYNTHSTSYSLSELSVQANGQNATNNSDTMNRTRWQNVIKAINTANSITNGCIICGTSAGYQNIAANVSFDLTYPLLYSGTTITAASGTTDNTYLSINGINVTSNGAVQSATQYAMVYLKGTLSGNTITIASSNYLTCSIPTTSDGFVYIPLGIFYNSTTNIYFNSSKELWAYVDGAFGPVSVREASAAAKTATNYISADSTGIRIASASPSTQNQRLELTSSTLKMYDASNYQRLKLDSTNGVIIGKESYGHTQVTDTGLFIYDVNNKKRAQVDNNGLSVYLSDGTTSIANFGEVTRIGKAYDANANDNESHIELDYHSLQLIDKNNHAFFYVSDLRGADGSADIVDVFYGDGSTRRYDLSFGATTDDYTITLSNGNNPNLMNKFNTYFTFNNAPASGIVITVTYKTTNSSAKAFTFGERKSNQSTGARSFVNGINAVASGTYSAVLNGYDNTSSGKSAISFGKNSTASGDFSIAGGKQGAVASGEESIAFGYNTTASGYNSIAIGTSVHATGTQSCAIGGTQNTASGIYSHAEGLQTTAQGQSSHSEGTYCQAQGPYSHAQGYNTKSSGSCSEAAGSDTIAAGACQTVIGKFNKSDASGNNGLYAFIIGNGTADDARSNALAVNWNGTIESGIAGYGATTWLDILKGNAALYVPKDPDAMSNPVGALVMETAAGGAWVLSNYNDEGFRLVYMTAENRAGGTNTATMPVKINADGSIVTSRDINTTSTSGIFTAGSGITVAVFKFCQRGNVAAFYIGASKSTATAANTVITVGTVAAGRRPPFECAGPGTSGVGDAYINENGVISFRSTSQIAANARFYVRVTYPVV